MGAQFLEAGGVARDVILVDPTVANQNVGDAVQQGDVRARFERQKDIRHHRRLGDPRIGHDQSGAGILQQALAEDGMVLGDVGADQQNHVGFGQIVVAAGRAVAAEAAFVAGHGARHAQRGVAVVVVGAEAKLHQFAKGVEFLGDQLSGADDAECARAVARLNAAYALHHHGDRFVPPDALQLAVLAQHGILGAPVGGEGVVFAQSLGTELAAIHRVAFIAASGDSAAVLHAHQHAAADRTVAAGGRHPAVRYPRFGNVPDIGHRVHRRIFRRGYRGRPGASGSCGPPPGEGGGHALRHHGDKEEIARESFAGQRQDEGGGRSVQQWQHDPAREQ